MASEALSHARLRVTIESLPRLRRLLQRLALYVLLLAMMLVVLLPFFWMISTSFMTRGETITRQWLPQAPQVRNYSVAWTEGKFATYLGNSIVITITTLAGLMPTSILAGYAFARIRFAGREVVFMILLSTMMLPEAVTLLPNFLLIRGDVIPLPGGRWLNTLQALTVPFMANAFSIFLLRQFFRQIPAELWDAARLDGCSHLRFLLSVCLPLSKAPVLTVSLFGFLQAWDAFMWPLRVTTRDTWRPLMVGLWSFMDEAGPDTQFLMAGAVLALLPVLLLYMVLQKHFTTTLMTSGLKG
jgi:ABC-type glycerol-3-phosphate transport system permease component